MAVDEGVLVKTGPNVLVSVRRALGGTDLGRLRAAVEREFLTLDEHEQNVRSAQANMESDLIRRMATLHNEYAPEEKPEMPIPTLGQEVGVKAARKLRARRNSAQGVWFGLGMMGLVGWSVGDSNVAWRGAGYLVGPYYPGKHAWTLALLVAGLALAV